MKPQQGTPSPTPSPSPQPSQPTQVPIYKSGLYWRKVFVSFICPPGILSLENGQLKFRTKDAVIFGLPVLVK